MPPVRREQRPPRPSVISAAFVSVGLLVASPAESRAEGPASAAPEAPPPSAAAAITLEALVPLGGAGCLYRRRWVPGALVMLGTFITGTTLVYSAGKSDRDAVILNAVGYALLRAVGIVAVARPLGAEPGEPKPPAPIEPPREAARITLPPSFGLSHAFAF